MKSSTEFRREFNHQYNNLLNGNAPGLNDYEISLYLTKSSKEIADIYYRGAYTDGSSYEENERMRRALYPITKSAIITPPSGQPYFDTRAASIEINKDIRSYIITHGLDLFRICEESVLLDVDGKEVFSLVKPERHDYY